MDNTPSTISISCSNSQGERLAANALTLKRYSVVFEIYNPYSIVQISEVLTDFQIFLDQKIIYSGKATVSSLVNTGLFLVCEVVLENAWVDVDVFGVRSPKTLGDQMNDFFEDWEKSNDIVVPFKLAVSEAENLFLGMQKWLGRVDLNVRSAAAPNRLELEARVISEVKSQVSSRFEELLEPFVSAVQEVADDQAATHKAYVRRQLHPIVLSSPFIYRTYVKPLGYAGDYEMVNMILKQELDGASVFAKLLNYSLLKAAPAEAHRNRIDYLYQKIVRMAEQAVQEGRRLKVFNLGCGPAEEVRRVILNEEIADRIDFTLVDFNDETIEYARKGIDSARQRAGRQVGVEFVHKSVNQVLKSASKGQMSESNYDLVYCAGLFDYFSQKVCAKMVELFVRMVGDKGEVLVTNVADNNPLKEWMEYVMEWNLVHRNVNEMKALSPKGLSGIASDVHADATGVNLFLEVNVKKT